MNNGGTMKQKLLIILAAVIAMLFGVASTAAAQVPDDVNSIARIQISALAVQMAIGVIIPLVVGLLTKVGTSSGVKALVMLILNAVQTLIVQATMADGTAVIDKSTFIAWLLALVVSVATYAGVYKPLDLTSSTETGKLGPHSGPL